MANNSGPDNHVAAGNNLGRFDGVTVVGGPYDDGGVITLGIAIVGPDQHQARTWNLGIPVYQQSTAGTRSASQFRIVLSDPAACALPAGSLAYLFVGDRVEGPLPVAGP